MKIQMTYLPVDSNTPELIMGDPECNRDPCEHHGCCHCMCVCGMERGDDCADCTEIFED